MTTRPRRLPSRPTDVWEWLRRNAPAITALANLASAVLPAIEHFLQR